MKNATTFRSKDGLIHIVDDQMPSEVDGMDDLEITLCFFQSTYLRGRVEPWPYPTCIRCCVVAMLIS